MWLAVILSGLILAGGAGHLWLAHQRLEGASVVVEAAAAPAPVPSAALPAEGVDHGATGPDGLDAFPSGPPAAEGGGADCLPGAAGAPAKAGSAPAAPAAAVPAADTRININTAQPAELQRLPGIGPALAARIVEYREAWGPFSSVEDIMEVPGIGPRKFEDIKDLIKVD